MQKFEHLISEPNFIVQIKQGRMFQISDGQIPMSDFVLDAMFRCLAASNFIFLIVFFVQASEFVSSDLKCSDF